MSFILLIGKYSSAFGGGASQYAYFHEEDENSFQLVDTTKIQKPQYQRGRRVFQQVSSATCRIFYSKRSLCTQVGQVMTSIICVYILFPQFLQANVNLKMILQIKLLS